MRIMGLDIGDRRIGVAMSDPERIIASPIDVIIREDDSSAIAAINDLMNKWDVKHIVVGLPYSLNGSVGSQAEKVKAFADKLANETGAVIELKDERLSTVAVGRLLKESRNKKSRKLPRDDAAAAYILQGYLDSLKAGS